MRNPRIWIKEEKNDENKWEKKCSKPPIFGHEEERRDEQREG